MVNPIDSCLPPGKMANMGNSTLGRSTIIRTAGSTQLAAHSAHLRRTPGTKIRTRLHKRTKYTPVFLVAARRTDNRISHSILPFVASSRMINTYTR